KGEASSFCSYQPPRWSCLETAAREGSHLERGLEPVEVLLVRLGYEPPYPLGLVRVVEPHPPGQPGPFALVGIGHRHAEAVDRLQSPPGRRSSSTIVLVNPLGQE